MCMKNFFDNTFSKDMRKKTLLTILFHKYFIHSKNHSRNAINNPGYAKNAKNKFFQLFYIDLCDVRVKNIVANTWSKVLCS